MAGEVRMRSMLLTFLVLTAAGCGGGHNDGRDYGPMMMTGPSGVGSQGDAAAALVSVGPPGGSTGVPGSASITLRFSAPMAVAMEQYMDLHVGSIAGPLVPMSCAWSSDWTTLTCMPGAPLDARTTYVIHVGGGMTTRAGQPIDYYHYGPGMGGQWLMGGMMGWMHGGLSWGMMGPGWRGSNGSYGMEFPFTTA
jgi:hypothetical protein